MKKSVSDRLHENALNALPGPFARLEYMAGLRDSEGQCSHWGLAKMYEEAELMRGIEDTHQSVLSEVLSTQFPDLQREVQNADSQSLYIRSLTRKFRLLMPLTPHDGCRQHLKLVLFVLSCLAQQPHSDAEPASC